MFEILVNGERVNLLQVMPDVKSLSIKHHAGISIPIPSQLKEPISKWLYDLSQRCTGALIYRGVHISKESVVRI